MLDKSQMMITLMKDQIKKCKQKANGLSRSDNQAVKSKMYQFKLIKV
jgi:hypothetical protein